MDRNVPLWVLLICLLVFSLFTVAFGWSVKTTLSGNDRSGRLGEIAVEIASFPSLAKMALEELTGYATGDIEDEVNRVEREEFTDYSQFAPIATAEGIELPGLVYRAELQRLMAGWRLIAGTFDLNGRIENAILLMSPELEVVQTWVLSEVAVGDVQPEPRHRKFVHGVAATPDGSMIFTFDGSVSIQKFDACGERDWVTTGKFHHAVTLDETGETVWTFGDTSFDTNTTIAQVAVEDGAVLREITLDEIIEANPDIDPLGMRLRHRSESNENARNTEGEWLYDPVHYNDVDPLPSDIAGQFDGFDPGDLLVSSRSLNLIFVLDPVTLEIKWWRAGATQRQHDPDWLPNGEILVFNNRLSREYSDIITIDPETYEISVLVDGEEHDFYTRVRGKQQILSDGTIIVSSTQQGRAFEVTPDGEIVFEVVNLKPETEDTNYVLSEMSWFPPDYFDEEILRC